MSIAATLSTAVVSNSPQASRLSVVIGSIASMWPIVGTEAVATGALTRGALRWRYTAVHPNIYLDKDARRDLFTNTVAAWLWTGRKGIVAGRAAAALHGVQWIEDTVPIELIARHGRRQPGVVVRDEQIGDDEVCKVGELLVTTPARTGLDLARHLPRDAAVQDIACQELFQRLGWFHIRAHPQQSPTFILHRVRAALRQRGWR
jgi:hypothetical protein